MSNIIYKIGTKVYEKAIDLGKKTIDYCFDTRSNIENSFTIKSFINISEIPTIGINKDIVNYLLEMYSQHRFNILGSGWIKNSYDSLSFGFDKNVYSMNIKEQKFDRDGLWLKSVVRSTHFKESLKIWGMVSEKYVPIDWQKDIKSGYRYSAKKWYKEQKIAPLPGVDIKLPWELARLQHLPQYAIFCKILPEKRKIILEEYRNIILDFIVANPPRMGVNWKSSMDVAIRAINILISYDLILQFDEWKIFDRQFIDVMYASILDHGKHIYNNLEYSKSYTNNHYLSNLIGLLVISIYLRNNDLLHKWFCFSLKELKIEVGKQFFEDGSNYEGATAYHCLSSEMLLLALAYLNNICKDTVNLAKVLRIDTESAMINHPAILEINEIKKLLSEKLFLAGIFIKNILKDNGEIPQVGDNDSGRILKVMSYGEFITFAQAKEKYLNLINYYQKENKYFDINNLNYGPLLASISSLYEADNFGYYAAKYPLEYSIFNAINKSKIDPPEEYCTNKRYNNDIKINQYDLVFEKKTIIEPEVFNTLPLNNNSKVYAYNDFGVYIFKTDRVYLLITARTNNSKVINGHVHNDILSFELVIDGKTYAIDPGSYVYTADILARNKYRSTEYHNTVFINSLEQNKFGERIDSLFKISKNYNCEILKIDQCNAHFMLSYRGINHYRHFQISENKVVITDKCNKSIKQTISTNKLYSNGYGQLIKSRL